MATGGYTNTEEEQGVTGEELEEDWEEDYPEVLFREVHVTHLPWGSDTDWEEIPRQPGFYQLPLQEVKASCLKLCHITHKKPAEQISEGGDFLFIPKPKVGKSGLDNYDGSPVGNSYVVRLPRGETPNKDTKYTHVHDDELLFPGSFIWWSVDPSCYETNAGDVQMQKVSPNFKCGYYPSEPLGSPRSLSSRYGSVKFSGYLKDICIAFQKSYQTETQGLPEVKFRSGGTLRYRFEICHVVIICAAIRSTSSALPLDDFPDWGDVKVEYHPDTGEITEIDPPSVTIKNGLASTYIKYHEDASKNDSSHFSWDNTVFALHFPSSDHRLSLPKSALIKSPIKHDYCTSTKPNDDGKFVCPDKL